MSQLLPPDIDGLSDCPYTIHNAITQALRILEYREFPSEERPPRRIWLDGQKLDEWWRQIERDRKQRYSGEDTSEDDDHDAEYNMVELITHG